MITSLDSSLYIIVALLPLVAGLLVSQANPYKALVIRGILGAIAARVYAILGAADVALTEALVGTMLAITLYAVAVRSSLVMRLGVLDTDADEETQPLMDVLRTALSEYQMRLERVTYPNQQALQQALIDKEIHGMCHRVGQSSTSVSTRERSPVEHSHVHITLRIRRLYDILEAETSAEGVTMSMHLNEHMEPGDSSAMLNAVSIGGEQTEPAEEAS